jgi:hypothetical protein
LEYRRKSMSEKKPEKNKPAPKTGAERTAEQEWKEQDAYLDEALRETIPASDPISPGHVQHRTKVPIEKG